MPNIYIILFEWCGWDDENFIQILSHDLPSFGSEPTHTSSHYMLFMHFLCNFFGNWVIQDDCFNPNKIKMKEEVEDCFIKN